MNKEDIKRSLLELRKNSKKRKFNQSVDLIINFKEVDKKYNLDVYSALPHSTGKDVKVCAVVDDMEKKVKGTVDHVISKENIGKLNAKEITKIAKDYDIFVAQASMMGQVATVFGRTLGPLGKMPNPKAGGVLMPDSNIEAVVEKFKKGLRIKNKNELSVKILVGKEDFKDNDLIDNIHVAHESVIHQLPNNEGNVKDSFLKFTMSKPVRLGKKIASGGKDE